MSNNEQGITNDEVISEFSSMNNKEEILSKVKEAVLEAVPQAEIVLFGSRSRGDYREESDWDFLILTESDATNILEEEIRGRLFDIELESAQAISIIIHSKKEWEKFKITPLYQNIAEEGELVWPKIRMN
jgi:predicted nucleotidyltransferase